LENWFDLLALVARRQLGMAAYQVGDRQFARILQSFLHDKRCKITLGRVEIIPPRPNVPIDRPMARDWYYGYKTMDLPDWPMPKNVKNFHTISLKFVVFLIIKLARLLWNYINNHPSKSSKLVDL
jgi:hypothetical protein